MPSKYVHLAGVCALVGGMAASANADFLGVTYQNQVVRISADGALATVGPTGFVNGAAGMSRDGAGRYVVPNVGGQLYDVNPETGHATLFEASFINGITGMAFDPALPSIMYATDYNILLTSRLWRVDTAAPIGEEAATLIGPTGSNMSALAFSPAGVLYTWSYDLGLCLVNPFTGVASDVSPFAPGGFEIETLCFSPDGQLWGAGSALFRIDRVTGGFNQLGLGWSASGYLVTGFEYIPAPGVATTMLLGAIAAMGRRRAPLTP